MLCERGKIAGRASDLLDKVAAEIHNGDPFDRLILSAAIANQSVLATKDRSLRATFPDLTVWE